MAHSCNKIINCPEDSSDENNCEMIHFDWTYKKEFVPIYMQNNMTIETLDLTKILTIEEVDSNFSCQLTQVHCCDHIKVNKN